MASSPSLPQDPAPDPNTPSQNPNITNPDQIQQTLPDDDAQFSKTLALEIPNPNTLEHDPTNQSHDDFEDLTLFSPSTTTTTTSRRAGGGRKAQKANLKRLVQVKKSEKKLETLSQTLNPIPFVPNKILDLSSHETLLKKLGLWEFVHLQFDTNIRADLLAQLIAGYNPAMRGSYVNEVKIMVNRTDLGRALKLPVKKDKSSVGDGVSEFMESAESIGFIEELVSNWILLHEDTWMMPPDILNWIKLIKEGNFEKLDWAGMIWYMVEKELNAEPILGNCYYASHLQSLIKCQREEFVQEHRIELSLGEMDDAGREEGGNVGDGDVMDFEERKEEEDQGQWEKISMDGHCLQPCGFSKVMGVECEEEGRSRMRREEEEGEDDEEEEEDDIGFHIAAKGNILERISSENLLEVMGAAQFPFSSGVQIHDNVSSGEFLDSRVDTETIPGGLMFGNSDIPHHSLNVGNKRMRSDGHWDAKPYMDFDSFEEEMQNMMGKTRMMMEEKEQSCQQLSMHQQVLCNELQQRDNFIQQLQKAKMEEQQKSQLEVYRLEHELYTMGNLLEGYRKALKECQLPVEPIYKDTGSGGLVLSTMEFEKQRLKQEEEERLNRVLLEKLVKEFESECIPKFEGHENTVKLLRDKLLVVGDKFNLLKEMYVKPKMLEMSECVATEDCSTAKESVPAEECVSAEESVSAVVHAPTEESVPVVERSPSEESVPMEECVPTEG
ncbi:abhydrolase domain-containing protein [Salix suchowensis]|nr:abhydrolase domain-containing protein [Salix suchowensis]